MKIILLFLIPFCAFAKLNILTTTTDLKSLVQTIGGDKVDVDSICKGTQDPHYLEAKPSYSLKANRADLMISIGLDLEIGWLPLIIAGARNPDIVNHHLVVGNYVETLEKPTGAVSRSMGDVHPLGNPHILLDPLNAVKIAEKIKDKLIVMDKDNEATYSKNFTDFSNLITEKMKVWGKHSGKKVITYHPTLSYFYKRFGITNVSILEPKPGIPPSASHILDVMKTAKEQNVQLAVVENFFDASVAERVAKDVPGMKVKSVAVSVDGADNIKTLIDLYDYLLKEIYE
jgi:zinc/manganese transport system substrate-binding protein